MKKTYMIFMILTLGILLGGIFVNGVSPLLFIDGAGFAMVVAPTILLLLSTFSWKEIGRAFAIGFRENSDVAELKQGFLFFQAAQKYLLFAGLIGFLMGFIVLLSFGKLGDERVGAGLALALVTMMYALILLFLVVFPFKNGIKKRLIEATGELE
jgi:flagellar motor component MotA